MVSSQKMLFAESSESLRTPAKEIDLNHHLQAPQRALSCDWKKTRFRTPAQSLALTTAGEQAWKSRLKSPSFRSPWRPSPRISWPLHPWYLPQLLKALELFELTKALQAQ